MLFILYGMYYVRSLTQASASTSGGNDETAKTIICRGLSHHSE